MVPLQVLCPKAQNLRDVGSDLHSLRGPSMGAPMVELILPVRVGIV